MADRTQAEGTMTRSELSTYLVSLGDEFERGGEQLSVDVGNKSVSLNPPDELEYDIEVVERSSVLRGNRETIDIKLSWKR